MGSKDSLFLGFKTWPDQCIGAPNLVLETAEMFLVIARLGDEISQTSKI